MGANADALEVALGALELNQEHDGLVEHARTLARLIDEFPTEVKLHGEYRQVMKMLLDAGQPQGIDAFAELLRELRGA